jgi:hypothetical protein
LILNFLELALSIVMDSNIEPNKIVDNFKFMVSLYVHYVCLWPVIARIYYITNLINLNYNFLTSNLFQNYGNISDYEKALDIETNSYIHKKKKYILKKIIFPLFGSFIFFWGLSLIGTFDDNLKIISCSLYSFMSSIDCFKSESCGELINSNLIFIILTSMKYTIDFVIGLYLLKFLLSTVHYKIKRDFLLLRVEIFLLFIFWYFFDNVYHFYKFHYDELSQTVRSFTSIFIDYLMNTSFILLYVVLTIKRSKFTEDNFFEKLTNFDLFMSYPIYFCYFKNYLKEVGDNLHFSLIFWKLHHEYFTNFDNNNLKKNREYANLLYERLLKFCDNNQSQNFNESKIISVSKFSSSQSELVRFINSIPEEIIHNINEAASKEFMVEDLKFIFEELNSYLKNNLYSNYMYMIRHNEHREKLKNFICCIEFDIPNN